MIIKKLYKCDKFHGYSVITGTDGKNYIFLSVPFRAVKEKELKEMPYIPVGNLQEEAEPYMYKFYGFQKEDPSSVSISELRSLAGISRPEFSRRYGVPIRTLEDWEAGRRTPPEYMISLLERVVKEDIKKEENN